ncbi:MAG: zf-HC2 domain-containing protein, partial [Acidobacteria bacterium]|nr:zf-HC2 domain-containing protein [Acidobacteriota bacterium]
MKCDDIKERLPWLANATLPPGERSEVIEHVRGCAACRSEYEATGDWLDALAGHPGPARITAFVFGGLFDGSEAAAIDAHLRSCERCRIEVQLARDSRATMPVAGSRWKPWAVAAALTVIAGASAAGWMWKER